MANSNFDVIVVGGGMVGAALAVRLDQEGFVVAIVEARQPEAYDGTSDYGLRVSAISPASQSLLEKIGAWRHVEAERLCHYSDMHVWENRQDQGLHFSASEIGRNSLGSIVENGLLLDALWKELGNVECFCPAKIEKLEIDSKKGRVTLDSGQVLTASLVVAADGGNSRTRELAGIDTYGWPYQQKGIVAVVETDRHHEHTAWQRFLPTGPVAFLPLDNGRCSIVWSAKDVLADELLEMSDSEFCARLTEASQTCLGEIQGIGPRAAFPLQYKQAEQYIAPRFALVGDAAHVVHPLAGQGVNLGFGDVECLTHRLVEGRCRGREVGDRKYLSRYARSRKSKCALYAQVMDGLNNAFSSSSLLVEIGRNTGLGLVNIIQPLRKTFAMSAGVERG